MRKMCEELLQAGLLQKRTQAELTLSRSPENHLKVRRGLQDLKGNQGRFRRVGDEGIARALENNRLHLRRSNLRRSPRIGLQEVVKEVEELTVKIDDLRLMHQRKELEREILAMYAHWQEVTRSSDLKLSESNLAM